MRTGVTLGDDAPAHATPRRSDEVLARFRGPPSRATAWLVSAAPIALVVAFLAWRAISGIYAKVGHAGAALDDSYIHFQYARAIAEGHPFRFEAGEPTTMGATSALWPLLLAPFYLLGCKGALIVWPAWVASFVALGLLAREVGLLTRPLAGPHAAIGATGMVLACSAFTWCAGSGMEVVPFAWCLVCAVRLSSDWIEAPRPGRRHAIALVALAFVAPLLRPEGALASVVIAAALLASTHAPARRTRPLCLLAILGAVTPQLLSWAVTGALQSNTAQVKLLPGNPYYAGPALVAILRDNLRTLLVVLLNGEIWSAEFIPHGAMLAAVAGLVAVLWCVRGRPLRFRATSILLLALAIATPCAYVSFLWNRLRYLWPFAPFWIVGLACLARALGDLLAWVKPRWRIATPVAAWTMVGLFAAKLEGTLDDLASSVSGIDRQQAELGRWAKRTLPPGARIGVNDTGAIAYFGDHPTFDIVGLTTNGEGRHWVAGAASRFEHYERLQRSNPAALPRYFIVYPDWMAMNDVLGARLHDVTVTDSTILGGQTMVAYEADYSLLGTGERPWTLARATDSSPRYLDVLDVADLDSERDHAYELLGAEDGDEAMTSASTPDGVTVADGGRRERRRERFRVSLGPGALAEGIVRVEASESTRVRVRVDGQDAGTFPVVSGEWVEATFAVPHARPDASVELVPDVGTLTTYHYWFVAPEAAGGTR
jgi:hypothetical protein